MSQETPHLPFGQFYGEVGAEVRVGELSLREVAGRPAAGIPRHTHEHAHFCLVVRGECETTTVNHDGRCGTSSLLFHPAGTTHEDRFVSRSGACIMVSLSRAVLDALGDPPLASSSITIDGEEVGFPGMRMLCELHRPDRFSHLVLEGLVLELLSRALARQPRLDGAPPWLGRAQEFLRDHSSGPLRVSDVARAAEVHPVHLARVFRERLGLSPGEYLRRVRVRRALELMGATGDGLAVIAYRAGFCDQSELTKAFRREIGTTPSRQRCLLGGPRAICERRSRKPLKR
jgi:AraC family transcriptional regulator